MVSNYSMLHGAEAPCRMYSSEACVLTDGPTAQSVHYSIVADLER